MRKILLSMLTVAALLLTAKFGHAQSEMKPLLTVSFSGQDKLFADLGAIGKLGGNPELGNRLEFMFKQLIQGKGLEGVDVKRPWGMIVLTDGRQKMPTYAFVPVTDLKKLIETLQGIPQVSEIIKSNNDVYEIKAKSGKPLYLQQKGTWAILANSNEELAQAPADPTKLLGDLPKNYNLAIRVSFKNVPKEQLDQTQAMLMMVAEAGSKQMPSESDEQYALRVSTLKQSVQQLVATIREMDELVLGWNVASSNHTTCLDLDITAKPGTTLEKELAQVKPGKSNFAGVMMPDAAVSANWTGLFRESDVLRAKNSLPLARASFLKELESQGLSEEQVKTASKLLDEAIAVLTKTLDSKKSDGGMALVLNPQGATLVSGAAVVDGDKLEGVLRQLVAEIKKIDPKLANFIKLDAGGHEGVRFHALSMPAPDEKLAALVGDNLDVIFGIANNRVWLAAGRDAAETLKKVIDQSKAKAGKDVPPMHAVVSLKALVKFIAVVGDNDQTKMQASMLANMLEGAGEKDHVVITAAPIAKGIRVRLEIEEGILKTLVSFATMMGLN